MGAEIAAGWYPDPQSSGQLRYWDGRGWTEHVQPGGVPAPPPAPAHPAAPEHAPPPPGEDDVERRLAALEEAVAALELRLGDAGRALGGESG